MLRDLPFLIQAMRDHSLKLGRFIRAIDPNSSSFLAINEARYIYSEMVFFFSRELMIVLYFLIYFVYKSPLLCLLSCLRINMNS